MPISQNVHRAWRYGVSHWKNAQKAGRSSFDVTMFSIFVAVAAHLAHRPFHKLWCFSTNFASFSIKRTQPKSIANFHSTWPFCWGVFWAMNSNWRPSPSSLVSCWKDSFSPALLHWMNLRILSSLAHNSCLDQRDHGFGCFILGLEEEISTRIGCIVECKQPKLWITKALFFDQTCINEKMLSRHLTPFLGLLVHIFLPGLGQSTISTILELVLQFPVIKHCRFWTVSSETCPSYWWSLLMSWGFFIIAQT